MEHFTVDEATGALTKQAADHATSGLTSTAVAVRPNGDSMYVADQTSNTISQYRIAPDGTPVPMSPATVAATGSASPVGLLVSADGLRLYLLNQGTEVVAWYNIGADGALSALVGSVATGAGPLAMVLSPDGHSLYVSNFTAGTISQYDVGAGGGLTAKSPASVAAVAKAAGIAVSPDGKSLYVTIQLNPGFVYAYDIDAATGKLTAKSTLVYSGLGNNPRGITVSPDGKSLYVGVSGASEIRMFDIDAATGALTPKSTPSVASGLAPFSILITTDALSAYAPNFSDGNVSQYDIDANGVLIPKSTPLVTGGFRMQSMASRALPGTKLGKLRSDQPLPTSMRPLPAPVVAALSDPSFSSYDGGAVYGVPSYDKDGRGMVHLSGLVKSSNLGNGVCVLHAAARLPAEQEGRLADRAVGGRHATWPWSARSGPTGRWSPNGANGASGAAYTSLDGVCFLAEQ